MPLSLFIPALLAPPACAACGRPTDEALCRGCLAHLRRLEPADAAVPGLDRAWAAFRYESPAREMVAALKFRGLVPLREAMARELAARAPAELWLGALVPVPADPRRRRSRGYDPAHELATALSSATGVGVWEGLRRDSGPRQVGRGRAERLLGPAGVRTVGPPPPAAVLVDDVRTTGATLEACARALRAGGAGHVAAVSFAHQPAPRAGVGGRGNRA